MGYKILYFYSTALLPPGLGLCKYYFFFSPLLFLFFCFFSKDSFSGTFFFFCLSQRRKGERAKEKTDTGRRGPSLLVSTVQRGAVRQGSTWGRPLLAAGALKCSRPARRWACRPGPPPLPPPPPLRPWGPGSAAGPGAGWTPAGPRSAPGRPAGSPGQDRQTDRRPQKGPTVRGPPPDPRTWLL